MGEALRIPCIATLDIYGGKHGSRIVIDNVERIPYGIHHVVSGIEHLLGREVDRVPIDMDDIFRHFVVALSNAWAFPDDRSSALSLDEGVKAIDEISLVG